MTPKAGSRTDATADSAGRPGRASTGAAVPPDARTFEDALSRLEEIVTRLERGEITLDESLSAFKEGSDLVRFCLDRLTAAEAAVQELLAGNEEAPVTRPAAGLERSGGPGDA